MEHRPVMIGGRAGNVNYEKNNPSTDCSCMVDVYNACVSQLHASQWNKGKRKQRMFDEYRNQIK
jgi:hypothetical protein